MTFSDQLLAFSLQLLPALSLGLLFMLTACMAVWCGRRLIRRLQFGVDSRILVLKAWKEVEEHVRVRDDTHLRMAIIKADAVLDMVLRLKMFPGQSLNARLNFAIHKYRNLKQVRWAHGLRNILTHEPLKKLARPQGLSAISAYRRALGELGAL